MAHHIFPSSVGTYLYGICSQLEPYSSNVHKEHHSRIMKDTLVGSLRLHGVSPNQKEALSQDDLVLIIDHYHNSQSHDDRLFVGMLTTGFHALLWLGEMAQLDNENLLDNRKIAKIAMVLISAVQKYKIPYIIKAMAQTIGDVPKHNWFIKHLCMFFTKSIASL
ncbi:hypothetical protein J132_04737 [Termitomyces sp. J132]|nr:hypothetical protein J132_04737 [Termitomyces sp. J132]